MISGRYYKEGSDYFFIYDDPNVAPARRAMHFHHTGRWTYYGLWSYDWQDCVDPVSKLEVIVTLGKLCSWVKVKQGREWMNVKVVA